MFNRSCMTTAGPVCIDRFAGEPTVHPPATEPNSTDLILKIRSTKSIFYVLTSPIRPVFTCASLPLSLHGLGPPCAIDFHFLFLRCLGRRQSGRSCGCSTPRPRVPGGSSRRGGRRTTPTCPRGTGWFATRGGTWPCCSCRRTTSGVRRGEKRSEKGGRRKGRGGRGEKKANAIHRRSYSSVSLAARRGHE